MKLLQILFTLFLFTSCASVPKQLVDAMDKQEEEIARVKKIYFENMNNQLDAIEKYRLAILDIYEEQYKNEIRQAPGTKKLKNGETVEDLVKPTGDDDIDVYNITKLKKIEEFFKKEREAVRSDIQTRRKEIKKAEANFENIALINSSVNEYLGSLVALKESRDKLAQSIRNKLGLISPIPVSFGDFPDPTLIEQLIKTQKVK